MSARDFFARAPQLVAVDLLGATLQSTIGGADGGVVARITEVEAYDEHDPASHTFRGRTARNATMFGEVGRLYVYLSYGIHRCANVVAHPPAGAGGVLIRAANLIDGHECARARRPNVRRDSELARGPGCLTAALGIDLGHDGLDLLATDSPIRLHRATAPGRAKISTMIRSGPRVGVARAADVSRRFWIADEPTVSAYKRSPRARLD